MYFVYCCILFSNDNKKEVIDSGLFSRCPHPGIPINGELKGLGEEGDFAVKKVVKFKCNEGYVMDGDEEQECLFFKQWSGEGAPKCVG